MDRAWREVPPVFAPDRDPQFATGVSADTLKAALDLRLEVYHDEQGEPWKLPSVSQAFHALRADHEWDHEYLTMEGYEPFLEASTDFLFGKNCVAVKEQRISSHQMLGGSGAIHTGSQILQRYYRFPTDRPTIFLPNPTCPKHATMLHATGVHTESYCYYNFESHAVNFLNMMSELRRLPNRSVILLHACAHKPTGMDPSQGQWQELAKLFLDRGHCAFFVCDNQGITSGDPEKDAYSVRLFAEERIPMLVCQSFASSTGLYGERIGALHILTHDADLSRRLHSQVNILLRREIGPCPKFSALIAALLLSEKPIHRQWLEDMHVIHKRVQTVRQTLYKALVHRYNIPGSWEHLLHDTGLFSLLGLSKKQCDRLAEEAQILVSTNSCINVAGLNPGNLDYFVRWVDRVVREERAT